MSQRVPDGHVPPCAETVKRLDWDRHRARVRAANRARSRAVKQLVAEHRAEFNRLFAELAAAEGVVPHPRKTEAEQIQAEIARLQAKLRSMGLESDG
jgi:hypothetical protein